MVKLFLHDTPEAREADHTICSWLIIVDIHEGYEYALNIIYLNYISGLISQLS